MSRLLLIVMTLILSMAVANAESDAFISNGPATQQQFQQNASGTNPSSGMAPHQSNSNAGSSAQSGNVVQQTATPPNTNPNATTQSPTQPSSGDLSALQQQLQRLSQVTVMQQQRTDQRIESLMQNNQTMQQQVERLSQSISAVSQRFEQFKQAQQQAKSSQTGAFAWLQKLDSQLSSGMKLLIVGALIFLALLIGLFMPRRKQIVYANAPSTAHAEREDIPVQAPVEKSAPVTSDVDSNADRASDIIIEPADATPEPAAQSEETASEATDVDDTESEYDFMNSVEAIPAKLDLARAYIAMEDYKAAREALEQVISGGDKEQQQEARELLETIPAEV